MKKRIWIIVAAAILVVALSVGVTVAFLVSSSTTIENTFTAGKVNITLTETTGSKYKLLPGTALHKDPRVKVLAGSEDCWVFVKVQKSADFDAFCTYEMADGWVALGSEEGVYYRQVKKSSADTDLSVLKNDIITVRDTVTEEQLGGLTQNPNLSFTAYAVQMDGVPTVNAAWKIIEP
ncbi:MAG: hypothetical protein IKL24_00230 [Clostridia bacterium]|nr:hypothetical protein [Clostridia bacterium]